MTDPAIIAASYSAEKNYSHNPDDVIDASDAVGAWGTTKESTTELSDLSGNGNIADIHGAMPAEGFIQSRRYGGVRDYLDCGNDVGLNATDMIEIELLLESKTFVATDGIITKNINGVITNPPYNIHQSVSGYTFSINNSANIAKWCSAGIDLNKLYYINCVFQNGVMYFYVDGKLKDSIEQTDIAITTGNLMYGQQKVGFNRFANIKLGYAAIHINGTSKYSERFNTLARLPFWSVNYTDYPDNVIEYTDNLPYSSSIISSGTFKVNDDKLQCVSAGTITYSASYEFDGSEYIKVKIGGVEYAGTGTITQGNTTVSVAQGSNKVTIQMGTGGTIEGEIGIQFREEV